MGKKSKKKQKKQTQAKNGTKNKTSAAAADPIYQFLAKKNYKKTTHLGEKVKFYKEKTQVYKSGL